ncbi:MAG: EF-hand domain-containing protein [Nitrosospira sp.]|nr:EF-hand domain-containing protein [Nitrosospira sp.]
MAISAAHVFGGSYPVLAGVHDESNSEVIAPPFELYDTNKDDYISIEEAAAMKMPARIFNGLDIDRDGRLNKEEFTKMPPIRLNENPPQ